LTRSEILDDEWMMNLENDFILWFAKKYDDKNSNLRTST
jgi:hypothetical protein